MNALLIMNKEVRVGRFLLIILLSPFILVFLILVNHGGRDPLISGIYSPDGLKYLYTYVYRLGQSNTYAELHFEKENYSVDVLEIKGVNSMDIKWLSNTEANIIIGRDYEIVKEDKNTNGIKINIIRRTSDFEMLYNNKINDQKK